MKRIVQLSGAVQHYAWGKPASTSSVAHFASAAGHVVNQSKPYAELWMGTHPSGPATLSTGQKLSEFIAENPAVMGSCAFSDSQNPLPFLMKVLSINQALSIQAHPNKDLAKILHKTNPEAYKDDNHKPELICAITPFEGLCGFRSIDEIKHFLSVIPELSFVANASILLGEEDIPEDSAYRKALLKKLYSSLMRAGDVEIEKATSSLIGRIKTNVGDIGLGKDLTDLVLRVNKDYPNDIGLFSVFFLNFVHLQPGEALFLAANEPHAYIFGEGVEIMACSDNVVRAGLTPKFKDVENLCEMLTYNHGPAEILQGVRETSHIKRFCPPVEEFQLVAYTIPHGGSRTSLISFDMPQILLVVKGKGSISSSSGEEVNVAPGSILFVAAGERLEASNSDEVLEVYSSSCGNAKTL